MAQIFSVESNAPIGNKNASASALAKARVVVSAQPFRSKSEVIDVPWRNRSMLLSFSRVCRLSWYNRHRGVSTSIRGA
jgi:hypothetical protein